MNEAQPSRTAMRVALRRAAHQVVDQVPLVFADPFAVPILGLAAREELRRTPSAARRPYSATLRAWVVARARYTEDVLAEAVRDGVRQYLLLGAGLDTFALRNGDPGLRVFEVDHPATQAWKRQLLASAELALPEHAHLVPVDFERDALEPALLAAGFDRSRRTVTAWLGVVPYLTADAFATTCRYLSGCAPGSELVMDYGQPRAVLPPVEQLMHDSLSARVLQAGEPFQLYFTPESLGTELHDFGLTVKVDLGSVELNRMYFEGRVDGLQLRGSAGRLCRAVVGVGQELQ